jgi:hypothetical protein
MKSYALFAGRPAGSNRSGIRAYSAYGRAAPADDSRAATGRCAVVTRCSLVACRCDANTGVMMSAIHENVRRRKLRTACSFAVRLCQKARRFGAARFPCIEAWCVTEDGAESCGPNYRFVEPAISRAVNYTSRASKAAISASSTPELQGLSHERFHPDHRG